MAQQGEDNPELAGVAAFILLIAFYLLYNFAFEYFIYVWKFLVIPPLAVLKYAPAALTDLLFFWTDYVIKDRSFGAFDFVWSNSADFFANDVGNVRQINFYIGNLLMPYISAYLFYKGFKIFNLRTFKSTYSVDSLSNYESSLWRQIKPVIHHHPEKEPDLNKGVWAMGLKPEKFVEKHDLLEYYETDAGDTRFYLKEDEAYDVFLQQMGKKWNGLKSLTKEERQLFGLFITKACRQSEEADEMIGDLAEAYTSEKLGPFFVDKWRRSKLMKKANKKVEKAIEKYYKKDVIQSVIDSHFYKKTVLSGLLEEARKDGVLATADFIWLKPKNRPLWYMLNNIGRRSSWPECSGPWSHFWAEKLLERKVANPMIGEALKALDEYLEYCSDEYDSLKQEEDEERSEL